MIAILIQIGLTVLLPAYIILNLCTSKYPTTLMRHLGVLSTGLGLLVLFFIARWDVLVYLLRYVWLGAFVIAAGVAYYKAINIEAKQPKMYTVAGSVAGVLFMAGLLAYILFSVKVPTGAVDIASPLKGGTYVVGQAGNSPLINYHNSHKTQKYAVDIVQFKPLNNPFSNRENLNAYDIYDQTIYSPCSGVVESAVNDKPDLVPPKTDRDNLGGNEVVITCKGVTLAIAHMKKGSVAVTGGQIVRTGQAIGKVGNSGNTSEPHIHIHAVKAGQDIDKGKPVALTINGKFLVRNDLLK